MPNTANYSDFVLVEVSHLPNDTLNRIPAFFSQHGKKGLKELEAHIQQKIDFTKKQIQLHTKPGDVVLIEAPEGKSFQQFLKQQSVHGNRLTPEKHDWLNMNWQLWIKTEANMYAEIARYAQNLGRRVQTTEYGVTRTGSRLHTEGANIPFMPPETRQRFIDIFSHRRHIGIERRINKHKPAMVICAAGHAAQLETDFKPKKVIYQNPNLRTKWTSPAAIASFKKEAGRYLKEREQRKSVRQIQRQRKKQGPPKK